MKITLPEVHSGNATLKKDQLRGASKSNWLWKNLTKNLFFLKRFFPYLTQNRTPAHVPIQKFPQLINPIFHISLTVSRNRTIYITATRALTNHRAAIGARLNFELLHTHTYKYCYESANFKSIYLIVFGIRLRIRWFFILGTVSGVWKWVLPLIYAFVRWIILGCVSSVRTPR